MLAAVSAKALLSMAIILCLVIVFANGAPAKADVKTDLACFTCERMPEDTRYCVAKRYAHPYICCMYIECNATCSAFETACPTVPGNANQLQYFSYVDQTCVPPSQSTCTSDSNAMCGSDATTAAVYTTAHTTAEASTTAPTTAPTTASSGRCQLLNRSPASAAYDPSKQVAFCAIKTTEFQAETPLTYDKLLLDVNSRFVLSNGTLPYTAGTYFFHSSLGVPRTTASRSRTYEATVLKEGLERTANNNNGVDLVSKEYLRTVSSYSYLDSDIMGYSDNLGQTSWMGFRLDDLFEPLSVFSVALSADMTRTGIIAYTTVLVNIGSDWDIGYDQYNVPSSGIYFFTIVNGAIPQNGFTVGLYVNGGRKTQLRVSSNTHNGVEAYSKSCALQLAMGDDVNAQLTFGALNSNTYLNTQLQGFLYRPIHGVSVIWSVHKTLNATGRIDPLPFENIMINDGEAWNSDSSDICVPATGVYYMTVNAATVTGQKINVQLLANDVPLFEIRRESTQHNGIEPRTRSIVTRLAQGDRVRVSLLSGFVYSDANLLTSFTGFLVFPL